LKDVMIIILLIAAAISFVVAIAEGNKEEFFEPVLILAIVVLNAVLGVSQESKAEKAMEALKNMSAPHARVIRDGTEKVIDASTLVPGDIILVEAGDFTPADARLIEAASLKSDESALTGESVPAEKDAQALVEEDAPLGDRKNMIYSGCSIVYGRAKAVVTATGMNTEMGKIANLLEGAGQALTPLQMKLKQLGKTLGIVALAACAVIFVIGLISGMHVMEIFMTAVSLAVSAIPEGLPAIVTIVLSMGMLRLSKQNAVIRRLPAVETLGSASVICSDKTGTLTQNRMTVVSAYAAQGDAAEDITDKNSESIRNVLLRATLCCDGSFSINEEGKEVHIGDPTETGIVAAAYKNGLFKDELNQAHPRLFELPFDSDRKLMTTVHEFDGEIYSVTKGAFDVIASRCKEDVPEKIEKLVNEMGERALRVLAIAEKKLEKAPSKEDAETLENDLTIIGLVGMIDPPRPEAREAVKECKKAGIRPVMITGDHVVTAAAIARDLGILNEGQRAITGRELQKMTDEELKKAV
ncbi:MAG: HAD-IC family P-type ATPase, partial [Clostridia bacterium]|nr:HAD-IC family P-type ATPase [Clostridia bacterium]